MGSTILCWFSAAVSFPEHIGFNADPDPCVGGFKYDVFSSKNIFSVIKIKNAGQDPNRDLIWIEQQPGPEAGISKMSGFGSGYGFSESGFETLIFYYYFLVCLLKLLKAFTCGGLEGWREV